MNELIEIEVAYALPENQILEYLRVPYGTTVKQAIQLSGICNKLQGVNPDKENLGIYGKLVSPETVLRNYDRVEIYRPIIIDPKEKRRNRAKKVILNNKKNNM